jgi:protein-S-isoprenylcysteine O-methyltransferase Ste14
MNNRPGLHFLELKIPPLAIVVITAALMWLVARKTPDFAFHFSVRMAVALGVSLAGITFSATGSFTFRRAGTTLNPMKPESASALVQSGIYQRTRNPMYFGFLLDLLAWAIFLSNWLTFVFLPFFIAYMNRFQIEPEERALASRFGDEFATYKTKVRRWI